MDKNMKTQNSTCLVRAVIERGKVERQPEEKCVSYELGEEEAQGVGNDARDQQRLAKGNRLVRVIHRGVAAARTPAATGGGTCGVVAAAKGQREAGARAVVLIVLLDIVLVLVVWMMRMVAAASHQR